MIGHASFSWHGDNPHIARLAEGERNDRHLIELIEAQKTPPVSEVSATRPRARRVWLVAVWMKEDGDSEGVAYETRVICTGPSGMIFSTGDDKLPFTFEPGILFHRLTVPEFELPGFPALGTYIVEAAIREAGSEDEWFAKQTYPFVVREHVDPVKLTIAPHTSLELSPSEEKLMLNDA